MYFFKDFHVLNPTEFDAFDFYKASVLVRDGIIADIFPEGTNSEVPDKAEIINGNFHSIIFPGLIQTHIHMCQTLHRNMAENIALLPWLRDHIWPYEASLTKKSMGLSVLNALKEIVSSGTTAVLDMGTVRHQDVIFEVMDLAGFRYTGGKAMMDMGEGVPQDLAEKTDTSISQSMELFEKFDNTANGRLHYAFAPRFVLSCTNGLLQEVRKLSDRHGVLIHTHGSEHKEEVEYIRSKTGFGNISYLNHIGALNERSVIAHTVHLDDDEIEMVRQMGVSCVHCPSTNLKLGSGIAPIHDYIKKGITVGIGADGAPCNNALNIFNEIKMASLLQKGLNHDASIMIAKDALRLATINGAKILRNKKIGKIKKGMEADLICLDMDTPQTVNFIHHPSATVVFSCDPRNVTGTMVAGKFLYRNREFSKEINDLQRFFEQMED